MKAITLVVGLLFIASAVVTRPDAAAQQDASYIAGFLFGRLLFGGLGVFIIATPYLFAGLLSKLQSKQPDVQDYAALRNAFSNTGSYFSKSTDDDVVPLTSATSRATILPALSTTASTGRLGPQFGLYSPRSVATHNTMVALGAMSFLGLVSYLGWFMATSQTMEWTTTKIFGWVVGGATIVGVTVGTALYVMRPTAKQTVGLFEGGLAFDDGKKTDTVTWDEIADLYIPFAMRSSTWHVTTYNGRKIRFSGYMENNEHFIKSILHVGIDEIVRHKLTRIAAGQTVKIGYYEVNRGGFGVRNRMFAWNDIASAIFLLIVGQRQSRKLRINLRGKFFTWTSDEMLAMPSWEIFQQVLQRVAPPHIWSKQAMPWM